MEYPLAESIKQYYYSLILAGVIDSIENTDFKIKNTNKIKQEKLHFSLDWIKIIIKNSIIQKLFGGNFRKHQ